MINKQPNEGRDMQVDNSLELELLSELRAALADREICAEIHEGVGGLAIQTDIPVCPRWVFVSFSRRYFSWEHANKQHPVTDIQGAARRLAAEQRPNGTTGDTAS